MRVLADALEVSWNEVEPTLPPAIALWHWAETSRQDRTCDESRIVRLDTTLPEAYRPAAGLRFVMRSYSVDEEALVVATAKRVTSRTRLGHGDEGKLFVVHPSAGPHYRSAFARLRRMGHVRRHDDLDAWPTASSRSLFVRPREKATDPVSIVKVSLPIRIAGERRGVSLRSMLRAVHGSAVLSRETDLPQLFGHLPEFLGIALRSLPNSGLLWREIPEVIARGRSTLLPLFSLWASGRRSRPLLLCLAERCGAKPLDFVREVLVSGYARIWCALTVRHGLALEPHAQNLLLEVDAGGRVPGRIWHRDMEDLHIDYAYRWAAERFVPRRLRFTESRNATYRERELTKWLGRSLHTYFQGGVLWPLERSFATWLRRGLVDRAPSRGQLEREFVQCLARELGVRRGHPVHLTRRGGRPLADAIYAARASAIRRPLPEWDTLPFALVEV
jgi:hypothetical protein